MPEAAFIPFPRESAAFAEAVLGPLAEHDDHLLADYLEEREVGHRRLRRRLAALTRGVRVHPVMFGSAITGAGIEALRDGFASLLPASEAEPDGPLGGAVFKVERSSNGEKVALVSLRSGTIRVREQVAYGRGRDAKVTGLSVFEDGNVERTSSIEAGQIGRISGLAHVQIGDAIGVSGTPGARHFSPPTLETVVSPRDESQRGALHVALAQLTEQDPLINLQQDDRWRQLSVSLYGEVQKEVLGTSLANDYGIAVDFEETTVLHVERPLGSGQALEVKREGDNPFLATVGLRVDPAPESGGVAFEVDAAVHGTMPAAFFRAIEDTVAETLGQGLHGWPVVDCRVTLTRTGYSPRQSHAHQRFSKSMSSTGEDFRKLTPLVLIEALREARTEVLEPMNHFRLEIPGTALASVLSILTALRARPEGQAERAALMVLEGEMPAAGVAELQRGLPGITGGEGTVEVSFRRYAPVTGLPPERARRDHNPLDRREYLLHVQRRV